MRCCLLTEKIQKPFGPRRDKTCLRGFPTKRVSKQSLHLQRLARKNLNFAYSKLRSSTFQNAINKGADQTARLRRLVSACVVREPPKTGFLATRPNFESCLKKSDE